MEELNMQRCGTMIVPIPNLIIFKTHSHNKLSRKFSIRKKYMSLQPSHVIFPVFLFVCPLLLRTEAGPTKIKNHKLIESSK